MNYIELTQTIAQRFSRCAKRKVGCVVVRGNVLLSVGFNHGTHEQCYCSLNSKNPDVVHAEQMALSGDKDYSGSVLYVNHPPCMDCLNLIKSKQIKEVIYLDRGN